MEFKVSKICQLRYVQVFFSVTPGRAGFPPGDFVGSPIVSMGGITSHSQSVAYSSSFHAVPQRHLVLKPPQLENFFLGAVTSHILFDLVFLLIYSESFHTIWVLIAGPLACERRWHNCVTGIAACCIVAALRSGWHHLTTSAEAKLLSAPCLCHTHSQRMSTLSFSCCYANVKTDLFPPQLVSVSGKTNSFS